MFKRIAIVLLVLLNIGCDQISKNVVRNHVDPREYIQVLGDKLVLTNVENTGAMLGFGSNLSPILKIIFLQALPVIVLIVLLFRVLRDSSMNKWLVFAFACVIGGGIGNLIDRIAHGKVTDFFYIDLGGYFKTGIFNMADVSVTLGVLLILFLNFRFRKLEL